MNLMTKHIKENFRYPKELQLKKNEVVLNVTWKESEMWICTKDTATGIVYFREKSNWGVMEGTIILK